MNATLCLEEQFPGNSACEDRRCQPYYSSPIRKGYYMIDGPIGFNGRAWTLTGGIP
jgi:hypothetical protein